MINLNRWAIKPPLGAKPNLDHPSLRGIVGWWIFNEGGGNNVIDLSRSNKIGTLTNGPTWTNGVMGPAVSFTGASNQYISAGTDLGLAGRTANMTITGWAYRASSGDHGAFVKLGNNTYFTGGDGLSIGVGYPYLEDSGDNLLVLYEGQAWFDTALAVGLGWHHFAIVIDPDGSPIIYWDGNFIFYTYFTTMNGIGSLGDSVFQIGGYDSSVPSNRYFTGKLDDIRVYDRPLSAQEIKELYVDPFSAFNISNRRILSRSSVSSSFNPAWASQSNQIISRIAA